MTRARGAGLAARTALAAALVAGSLMLAPRGAAQEAEPVLKDLIPDGAVADPEGWAGGMPGTGITPGTGSAGADPAGAPGTGIDPAAPLAEFPGFVLPWPDTLPEPPALASLPPDPELSAALAEYAEQPTDAVQGEEIAVAPHLTLVFPANLATFPEREKFLDSFGSLSTIKKLDTDNDSIAQIAARARVDRDLITRLLRIYGYYDATVAQTVGNPNVRDSELVDTPDKQIAVRFDVVPGNRYRFGAIDFGQLAQTGPDYGPLRTGFGINTGEPIDNHRIVAARDKLDTDLGENGYAFADVGTPDLLVDHKREEGDLTVPVAPGGKFAFGRVISQNPRFLSSRHLERIARFEPGDLYKRTEQEDLKRAILATGLVSSVTVTPRAVVPPPAPGQTGEVAMDVALVPGPLRTVAGLVGYESGDGARIEASWEHRNLIPPEGMLRVRGIAGTREQLLGTTLRWNNFRGRDQVLTLDLYANTVSRTAYNARTVAATATFEKLTTLLFQKPWVWSVGLEVVATGERESAVTGQFVPRDTYFVAALPLRAAFDSSDNLLDPTRGWRAALRLSPELSKRQGGRTVNYARVQFDASVYKSVTDKVILAARTRLGTIPGTDLGNIAPSRRFYAGGGGSVRGYGYQEIGPRDEVGDPSGGRSLVEFSLEARVSTGLMGGALQLVPFIDAGAVSERVRPDFRDIRYGAGLGIRYKTGFGPIRLDVGTPLNRRPGDSRVTVSVALGQAF
ncbi:MAG: BamA/TamA family outer membrane protein [Pseudomonadota bacterium]